MKTGKEINLEIEKNIKILIKNQAVKKINVTFVSQ